MKSVCRPPIRRYCTRAPIAHVGPNHKAPGKPISKTKNSPGEAVSRAYNTDQEKMAYASTDDQFSISSALSLACSIPSLLPRPF